MPYQGTVSLLKKLKMAMETPISSKGWNSSFSANTAGRSCALYQSPFSPGNSAAIFYLRFRRRSRSVTEPILYWTVLAETTIP